MTADAGSEPGFSRPGFSRVGVLGLGLLGGSVALRLTDTGATVCGLDPDPRTREAAAARGVTSYDAPGAWLADCDLVVLATPLDVMEEALAAAAPWLRDEAVVTDVGSVKQPVHAMVERVGLADRFVGGHPMAGTEHSGFAHADAGLTVGASWAVTLAGDGAAEHAVRLIGFLVERFEARVCVLPPQVHDQSAAVVSHVPHLLANLLLEHAETSPHRDVAAHLAAGSFRDATRVAGTNPLRTWNMLRANQAPVAAELRRLHDRLGSLVASLEEESAPPEEVRAFLDGVQERAESVRDPECRMLSVAEVDAAAVRALLAQPERAHVIT